jgi:hypothetical protein
VIPWFHQSLLFTNSACTATTGQPALVYLVPATLGSVALTAVNRGELARLLAFKEPEKDNEEDN